MIVRRPTDPGFSSPFTSAADGVVDGVHRAVVERLDLADVLRVGRGLEPSPTGLWYLKRPRYAGSVNFGAVRRGRGVRENARSRKRPSRKNGLSFSRKPSMAFVDVGLEEHRIGRAVELLITGKTNRPSCECRTGKSGRFAFECALTDQLAEVERGSVDALEAEIDAAEDVAGVVADHARSKSLPEQAATAAHRSPSRGLPRSETSSARRGDARDAR